MRRRRRRGQRDGVQVGETGSRRNGTTQRSTTQQNKHTTQRETNGWRTGRCATQVDVLRGPVHLRTWPGRAVARQWKHKRRQRLGQRQGSAFAQWCRQRVRSLECDLRGGLCRGELCPDGLEGWVRDERTVAELQCGGGWVSMLLLETLLEHGLAAAELHRRRRQTRGD